MAGLAYDVLLRRWDDTTQLVDMDVPGWDASLDEFVAVVSLIGKADGVTRLTVQIPEDARPIAKSRVKVLLANDDLGELVKIRIYGVGYESGGVTVLAWLLPDRSVELGEDSRMADLMLETG